MTEPWYWSLAARRIGIATVLYVVLVVAAAATSGLSGGKEFALVTWIVATLALMIALVRSAQQSSLLTRSAT
jgi:hypothetical protein